MRTSNRSHSNATRISAALTASVMTLASLTSSAARADENGVSPDGKGVTGGALLGAEVVTIVESIARVHSPAAFIVGAVLGAGAGGVGGYFVEHNSSDGKAPVYLLAGGLGLIIPALVLSLNATRYQPRENAVEDHSPTNNAPAANPGVPGGSAVAPATAVPTTTTVPTTMSPPPPAPVPPPPPPVAPAPSAAPKTGQLESAPHLSLFDVSGGGLHLGVPVPQVKQTFSAAELRQYGLAQQTEVRMPLVHVTF
jgi:hypothetical protein